MERDFANYNRDLEIMNFRRLIAAIDRIGLSRHQETTRRFDRVAIKKVLLELSQNDADLGRIDPFNQFDDFEYMLDIEPSCRAQWGNHLIESTLSFSPKTDVDSMATILIVVRSAVNNYSVRNAIRNTWYLNRTIDDLIAFKTVFMVGACGEQNPVPYPASNQANSTELCKKAIHNESMHFGDIIQSSGIDNYYKLTIKTFMTLRYNVERCPSDFTLTIDDDFAFEVNNFMKHLLEVASMESYGTPVTSSSPVVASKQVYHLEGSAEEPNLSSRPKLALIVRDMEEARSNKLQTLNRLRSLSNQYLYRGNLQNYARPARHLGDKWYVTQQEYEYDRYPPYLSGGSVLMSFKTIKHIYLASYFTRSFIFDDVYLGMITYKLGLIPEHNKNFLCSAKEYLAADPIRNANATPCIGAHEVKPDKLLEIWLQRKASPE